MALVQVSFALAPDNTTSSAHAKALEIGDTERAFRLRFALAVSVAGLIGLIGNGLLLCFYGNQYTRTYRSRDAIYIRRMAYADALICMVVIPYAVLFEADLIMTEFTCKTMEFLRHLLTYLSHLLLYTYSWELPQRHMYAESKTYNVNTSMFSIFMSILGAAPALIIFRVAQYNQTETANLTYHAPALRYKTCHLPTSQVIDSEDFDLKVLTSIYFLVPVVIYSICLYWYIVNLIGYLNAMDISQKNSIFLTNLEDIYLFEKASSIGSSQLGSRQRSWTRKIPRTLILTEEDGSKTTIEAEQIFRDGLATVGLIKPSDSATGRQELVAVPSYRVAYGDRQRISLRSSDSTESTNSLYSEASRTGGEESDGEGDVTTIRSDNNNNSSSSQQRKVARLKAKISFVDVNSPKGVQKTLQRRGTGFVPRLKDTKSESTISTNSEGASDKTGQQTIEVDTRQERKRSSRKPHRPILAREKAQGVRLYPRVGSYKKSLASLILIDLVLIPVVMALYLIMGSNSVLLNIVHLKSVIPFYFLSLINPYLRHCVWGSEKCVCFPPASDKRYLQGKGSGSIRPSVLQVRFVKERNRRKQERRKLQQQARQALNMDGTEIE